MTAIESGSSGDVPPGVVPYFTSRWAEGRHPVLRWIHARRLRKDLSLVLRYAGKQRSFLDYGCGDGYVLRRAASAYAHVVGVDLLNEALTAARQIGIPQNGAVGLVGELDGLAARYGPFDTVGMFQVIEHVSDVERDRIFDAVDRVTAPDATIIVEVPIESGPILIVKVLGGFLLRVTSFGKYRREPYGFRDLIRRLSVKKSPHLRLEGRGVGGGFGHKDFSVWNLDRYLETRYQVVRRRFLPINGLRWFNFQAIFVCTPRATARREAIEPG